MFFENTVLIVTQTTIIWLCLNLFQSTDPWIFRLFPFRSGGREVASDFKREIDKVVSLPGRPASLVKGLRNHVVRGS